MSDQKPRVLCVDDESNILDGLRRHLRRHFEIHTAPGSREGLGLMEAEEEPFVVVVSDLQMPEMNGIDFLKEVRERSPDTTRILLTGNADLSSAVSAVNEGNIFRFLTKPCPNEVLIQAVSAGVEQHRL
ncbi:MAG: response regulator, partial [Myxococcales bacterium]|nr:response regulator [Myxococcales bacterium]